MKQINHLRHLEPMTSGSIAKRIASFAMPLILGNLFQQLYNIVDALIVGNFLGSAALAAVSSSGSLIFMLIGFMMGMANGAGVVVSHYFGAHDFNRLTKAVHTTMALGIVSGILMTILAMAMTPTILVWLETPESVMDESISYLMTYFAGTFAFVIYNVQVGILQAVGDSRSPLNYLIASTILNLILDIVFIGILGFGVASAAIATVISQLFSAALCLIRLTNTTEAYRVEIKKISFDLTVLKQILNIGLPSGIQNSLIAFSNIVIQANINVFGEMAMAGYGASAKIEGLAFIPISGIQMAVTTFVGQNLGAKEYDRALKGGKLGMLSMVVLAELIGLIMFIFAPELIMAFDTTPEVVMRGIEKTRITALFYCLLAYSHSISAVLRGAGKSIVPMTVMMICWCVTRVVVLGITVPIFHNILIVCWIYPFTWALSSIALFIYYRAVFLKAVYSNHI